MPFPLDQLQLFINQLNVEHYIVTSAIRNSQATLRRIRAAHERRFVAFLGPKGFGKTCALK